MKDEIKKPNIEKDDLTSKEIEKAENAYRNFRSGMRFRDDEVNELVEALLKWATFWEKEFEPNKLFEHTEFILSKYRKNMCSDCLGEGKVIVTCPECKNDSSVYSCNTCNTVGQWRDICPTCKGLGYGWKRNKVKDE